MSGRSSKRLRRAVRKVVTDGQRDFINALCQRPFSDRAQLALRVLFGRPVKQK